MKKPRLITQDRWYIDGKFDLLNQTLSQRTNNDDFRSPENLFKQMLSLSGQANRCVTFDIIKAKTTRLEVTRDVTIPKGLNMRKRACACRDINNFLLKCIVWWLQLNLLSSQTRLDNESVFLKSLVV